MNGTGADPHLGVSLPENLLEKFDEIITKRG